jgi:hypothetical protein
MESRLDDMEARLDRIEQRLRIAPGTGRGGKRRIPDRVEGPFKAGAAGPGIASLEPDRVPTPRQLQAALTEVQDDLQELAKDLETLSDAYENRVKFFNAQSPAWKKARGAERKLLEAIKGFLEANGMKDLTAPK